MLIWQRVFSYIGITVLALATTTGCISFVEDPRLLAAQPAPRRLGGRAWLAPVEISDRQFLEAKGHAVARLTLYLQQYLAEGGYFDEILLLPGTVAANDRVLKVDFERLESKMRLHPAYVPGAFLTATLYIWFGGPIWMFEENLSATVQVEDAGGNLLATVSAGRARAHNITVWRRLQPDALTSRTEVVRELFDQMAIQLSPAREGLDVR